MTSPVLTSYQDSTNDPILNPAHSPPEKHWALNHEIKAVDVVVHARRPAEQIPIIPGSGIKGRLMADSPPNDLGLHWTEIEAVNEIRAEVQAWQAAGCPGITEVTKQLLHHWTHIQPNSEQDRKIYFAQLEAVLTQIYLKEAKTPEAQTRRQKLKDINASANRGLNRLCHKMATGAGKTLAMAMLILWQSGNAQRNRKEYSNYILIFTPGLIVKERLLESLQPNPAYGLNCDYRAFNLVPNDPSWEKVVNDTHIQVHNFHRFQPQRAEEGLSGRAKDLIDSNRREKISRDRLETPAETASRLTSLPKNSGKPIYVINDEGHHCHSGPKNQNKPNTWLAGLFALNKQNKILTVTDMSATPVYFTESAANPPLFEWIVSDYPLIEALEAGLVKIPQSPLDSKSDDRYRNIYQACLEEEQRHQPKTSNSKALPFRWKDTDNPNCSALKDSLNLLYAAYAEEFQEWQQRYPEGERPITIPGNPVMAIIMNSIANANAMYEFVTDDGVGKPLFRNDNPQEPPRTLVLHSRIDQDKENAGALDKTVRSNTADLAAAYRRHYPHAWGDDATDDEILRGVLTTVGKPGQPGEHVRCVISVNMLTEGWDARNVTHILGFRAFQSSLLCEQAAGRALRRVAYDFEEDDPQHQRRLKPEYATIMGIPFPGISDPTQEKKKSNAHQQKHVQVSCHQPSLDITLPNIIRLQRNTANPIHSLRLKSNAQRLQEPIPRDRPITVKPEGSVGPGQVLTAENPTTRGSFFYKVAADLHNRIIKENAATADLSDKVQDLPANTLFAQLDRLLHQALAQKLIQGPQERDNWTQSQEEVNKVSKWLQDQLEIYDLDPAQPQPPMMQAIPHHSPPAIHAKSFSGRSTRSRNLYPGAAAKPAVKSPITHAVCDSGWEVEVARLLEELQQVTRWVRNYGLNWTLPYIAAGEYYQYRPDFVAVCPLKDGTELHLVIEVKGQELLNDVLKRDWAEHWCQAVNAHPDFNQNKIWQYLYLDELPTREYVESYIDQAIAAAEKKGE